MSGPSDFIEQDVIIEQTKLTIQHVSQDTQSDDGTTPMRRVPLSPISRSTANRLPQSVTSTPLDDARQSMEWRGRRPAARTGEQQRMAQYQQRAKQHVAEFQPSAPFVQLLNAVEDLHRIVPSPSPSHSHVPNTPTSQASSFVRPSSDFSQPYSQQYSQQHSQQHSQPYSTQLSGVYPQPIPINADRDVEFNPHHAAANGTMASLRGYATPFSLGGGNRYLNIPRGVPTMKNSAPSVSDSSSMDTSSASDSGSSSGSYSSSESSSSGSTSVSSKPKPPARPEQPANPFMPQVVLPQVVPERASPTPSSSHSSTETKTTAPSFTAEQKLAQMAARQKYQWVQQLLMTGTVFKKHCINHRGKLIKSPVVARFVFLSKDGRYIMWSKQDNPNYVNYATRHQLDFSLPTYKGRSDHKSFLPLVEVRKVVVGVTQDVNIRKGHALLDLGAPDERHLFTFVANRRTLTLEASTSEECEFYASAWNFYIFNTLNPVSAQRLQIQQAQQLQQQQQQQ